MESLFEVRLSVCGVRDFATRNPLVPASCFSFLRQKWQAKTTCKLALRHDQVTPSEIQIVKPAHTPQGWKQVTLLYHDVPHNVDSWLVYTPMNWKSSSYGVVYRSRVYNIHDNHSWSSHSAPHWGYMRWFSEKKRPPRWSTESVSAWRRKSRWPRLWASDPERELTVWTWSFESFTPLTISWICSMSLWWREPSG